MTTETSGSGRPVRPRDAASLIVLRGEGDAAEVLLGRRRPKASFIPDAFVFPGGRLDNEDCLVEPAQPLSDTTLASLIAKAQCTKARARGLATAAIRELFEETGLWLADRGDVGTKANGDWSAFRAQGLAPAHHKIRYFGRAITPPESPIRFHARFFVADAADVAGELKGSGELLDLGWYKLEAALHLPVIDVTEFMLKEVRAHARRAMTSGSPFFSYRANRPLIRYL